jgi:hypothetical protein
MSAAAAFSGPVRVTHHDKYRYHLTTPRKKGHLDLTLEPNRVGSFIFPPFDVSPAPSKRYPT